MSPLSTTTAVDLAYVKRHHDSQLFLNACFQPNDKVWIKGHHKGQMMPVSEWLQIPFAPGRFICPFTYEPHALSRRSSLVASRPYVVFSSTWSYWQFRDAFEQLQECMPIRAIVMCRARKISNYRLEGWFDRPDVETLRQIEPVLLQMAPHVHPLAPRQLCRLPGFMMHGSFATLQYLRGAHVAEPTPDTSIIRVGGQDV